MILEGEVLFNLIKRKLPQSWTRHMISSSFSILGLTLWNVILDITNSSPLEDFLDEDPEVDATKILVLSVICVGTIIGNVAVILAIVARNIKVNKWFSPI